MCQIGHDYIYDSYSYLFFPFFMQGITPAKRRNVYFAAAKTLAAVHKVDVNSVGLQKYGRRDNYCKRQVGVF